MTKDSCASQCIDFFLFQSNRREKPNTILKLNITPLTGKSGFLLSHLDQHH